MSGDHTVRLVNEIDWRGALNQQRQAEREITGSYVRMEGASRKLDAATAASGLSWQKSAQLGQRAMTAMSAAIGATTAATAAGERAWLSLGTAILSSFAAGGPIAGGVALIGAAVGVMAGNAKTAQAEFARLAAETKKWSDGLEQSLRDSTLDRMATFLGADPAALKAMTENREEMREQQRSIESLSKAIEEAEANYAKWGFSHKKVSREAIEDMKRLVAEKEEALAKASRLDDELTRAYRQSMLIQAHEDGEPILGMRAQNRILGMGLESGFNRSSEQSVQDEIDAAQRKLEVVRALKQLEEQTDAIALRNHEREEDRLGDVIRVLSERLDITRQLNDLQVNRLNNGVEREIELLRARNDVERELIRLRHRSEDLLDQGASPMIVEEMNRAVMAAIAARPWQRLLASADQILGQGLSDIIYDGITNGFRNASDIAEQIWQALLRSLINEFVSSGIQGLLGGLGGGGGGDGLFGILGGVLGAVGGLFGGGGGGSVGGSIGGPPAIFDNAPILDGGCGPGG